MFNVQSIHIAMLMWGCIFSAIAVVCTCIIGKFEKKKRIFMALMQAACVILLGSDALAWWFKGNPGKTGYYMVRVSNFLVFLFSDIVLILFHHYVCAYLWDDDRKNTKMDKKRIIRFWLVDVLCVVAAILVVVSQYTDLYYYFDDNNFYHRTSAHILSFAIPMLGMLIDMSLIVQYGKNISRAIRISMFTYIVLPYVAAAVQTVYYGVSLINIAICISMILMFVVSVVEQNKEFAMKEREAANLRVSLMMSQIAPHFIYNALTTIKSLCIKDPEQARDTVDYFARYLRGNLDSINQTKCIPFMSELEHVKCYVEIEKKRFGDRVKVIYDIKEKDFMIPALTLQPLVENSIKHGICKKKGGGTVNIATERRDNDIYITVKDDGVGFIVDNVCNDEKNRSHVGIANVKNRLCSMCGGDMIIKSAVEEGTEVIIKLPQR